MILRSLVAGAALLLFAAGAASAQGSSEVLPPTGEGGVLPLEQILPEVRKAVEGVITDVELEREGDAWSYDVDVVSQDGQWTELKLDARSGKVLTKKVNSK